MKTGQDVSWGDDPGGEPESLGSLRDGGSEFERKHGIFEPSAVYPLFANSIRNSENKSSIEHMDDIGHLFSRFSEIASKNEYAWFKVHNFRKKS